MATLEQFTATMRYLEAGVNLASDRRPTKEQIAVYYDLLSDLPADVLHAAVQRVLLEHAFPTLPAPGLIRNAAVAMSQKSIPAAEAWRLAWGAVRAYGLDRYRDALAALPPAVARAVDCFGWRALCNSTDAELTQTRWVKVYQELATSEAREAALPPALRSGALAASERPAGALPQAVAGILGGIGREANGVAR